MTLNKAVALAMVEGPRAGLVLLEALDADGHLAQSHQLKAVRAHVLELAGEPEATRESYLGRRG